LLARGQIKLTSALLNLTFSCVKDNFGVVYITFGYVVGAYAYSLLWLLSLIAVNENTKLCDAKNHCRTNIFILIPFVMVYLWAFHVIKVSAYLYFGIQSEVRQDSFSYIRYHFEIYANRIRYGQQLLVLSEFGG